MNSSCILFYSIGLIISFLIDAVWRTYFYGLFNLKLNLYDKLKIIEHYHWGLLTIILYLIIRQTTLLGIGTGLIIAESLQDHPFAINKPYFLYSSFIGIVELSIIILLLVKP